MHSQVDPRFERIQKDLRSRYKELKDVHDEVVARARKLGGLGAGSRVALIVLGAVGTTNAVFDKIVPKDSRIGVLSFAVVGILTATIAGLEAAFKWERRSGELLSLAAVCSAAMHRMQDNWSQLMLDYPDRDPTWLERVEKAAAEDFTMLDAKLTEIYTRGSQLGVKTIAAYQMHLRPSEMFEDPVEPRQSTSGTSPAEPDKIITPRR